jgi:hypothetical protein
MFNFSHEYFSEVIICCFLIKSVSENLFLRQFEIYTDYFKGSH